MSDETDALDPLAAHPDLAAAAAALREEWRAEQEAATRDAHESLRHRLTLADRLREHMHRGDRLAVVVCGVQRFVGTVVEVGADLVAVRSPFAGRIDVHLAAGVPFAYEVFERGGGGHRGDGAAGGRFHHALVRREQDAEVTLGTVHDPAGVDARLVVGADHVVLVARAGAETVVPISQVAWVSARRR